MVRSMLLASLLLSATPVAAFAADVLPVGIPASAYPRVTRQWTDATGTHHLEATLVSATKTEVVLRKQDDATVTIPLSKLDEAARRIARDAYPYFAVEKTIQGVIAETEEKRPNLGGRAKYEYERDLFLRANEEMEEIKLCARYRIIAISGPSPSPAFGPKVQEYKVNVRPLYQLNGLPESSTASNVVQGYLNGWTFRAEDFDASKVVVNKSILEFTAAPFLGQAGHHHFHVMRLKYLIMGIGFGFNRPEIRVVTPGEDVEGELYALLEQPPIKPPLIENPAVSPARPDRGTPPTSTRQSALERVREAQKRAREAREKAGAGREKSREGPATGFAVEKDKTYNVTGVRLKRTFAADGHTVSITGSYHEITVTGSCERIIVVGSGNTVIAENAGLISMTGADNVVKYVGGLDGKPPKIVGAGLNEAVKIEAIEE